MKKLFMFGTILLIALLALVGCGEKESTELNLLCVPQEEWCEGMKQEFEAEFGITVNYVRMSTGEALARLEAETRKPAVRHHVGRPDRHLHLRDRRGPIPTL